jgi:hypothetical protein
MDLESLEVVWALIHWLTSGHPVHLLFVVFGLDISRELGKLDHICIQ